MTLMYSRASDSWRCEKKKEKASNTKSFLSVTTTSLSEQDDMHGI